MLPYQLAGVAVTLAALLLGRIPNPSTETDLMRTLTYVVLILFPIPLIFGGTIYRMIKALVMVKVFYVLGFTLLVACFLGVVVRRARGPPRVRLVRFRAGRRWNRRQCLLPAGEGRGAARARYHVAPAFHRPRRHRRGRG
jgi:hypothetical protein